MRVTYIVTLLLAILTLSTACNQPNGNALKLPAQRLSNPQPEPSPSPNNPSPTPTPQPTPNPTPQPTPSPSPTPSTVAQLIRNGEFLVSDETNHNFSINIPVLNGTYVNRIYIDVDVYVSNWDPTNSGGYHCLFWMQRGTWPRPFRWEENTVGYMNLRGPSYYGGRIAIETTINGNFNQGRKYNAELGRWYHLRYELNSKNGYARYEWSYNGNIEMEQQIPLNAAAIQIINGGFFIQFGTQIADEGPEAKTYGWRFANLKLQAY